jgi:pimeloyl-ACP methyl ester carboxylesterase
MKLVSRRPEFTISKQGISDIETILVGGVNQTIVIQSENSSNPILFILHGGPSMPVPGVSNRGADYALITCTKQLVKHFTVVYWDQRGTGKSYSKSILKETMRLNQFIHDANEVIDYLLMRFQQSKLHLLAHSWGTVIGLSLAKQYPEKLFSYTGISQITNWVENDKLCYRWLIEKASEANDQKALNELTKVGEPPYLEGFKQWAVMRKWLLKYKSMVFDVGDKGSATYFKAAKIMLTSPDYSLMDIYHSLISGFKLVYTEQMVDDLNTFDFFKEVPKINVPVLFIHGEKETHVWPELIQRYYEQLEAPYKHLFWAKKSSHAFHLDDAKEIEQLLINRLC